MIPRVLIHTGLGARMLAEHGACTVPTTARMTDATNLSRTVSSTALPALLLLLVTIAPPAIAARASRPGPGGSRSRAAGKRDVGASFNVEVSVAHRGRSAAAAIELYLSRDRVHDRADVRLAGGGRVPATGVRYGERADRCAGSDCEWSDAGELLRDRVRR
jgi:hypothetical protein